MIEALAATAAVRATPEAAEWLRAQLGKSGDAFHAAFGAAGKRIGQSPITRADAARITAAGLLVPAGMGADECARGALALAAIWAIPADEQVAFVRGLVERGDARERQAVLRVLAAMPEPARFSELAADACRTAVTTVFEAIACENSYPARWFSDEAFDRMVEQATSLQIVLERIDGLSLRRPGQRPG
jgi:hypothetical protein